jgi:hypothetical protein
VTDQYPGRYFLQLAALRTGSLSPGTSERPFIPRALSEASEEYIGLDDLEGLFGPELTSYESGEGSHDKVDERSTANAEGSIGAADSFVPGSKRPAPAEEADSTTEAEADPRGKKDTESAKKVKLRNKK